MEPFADSQRLKEAIEIQKVSTRFEKKVLEFKTTNSNRVFRKIKNKLKIADFDEMFYYQFIVKPKVFRWILLGYSVIFLVFFTVMIIIGSMSEKADYYNSEPDFILDYNWLSTGYIRT